MRLPTLRTIPAPVEVGEDVYQEFTAGTIPVRHLITDREGRIVFVEHERGYLAAFDEHLAAVRRGEVRGRGVHYTVTWDAMTGGETRPTVVRLELRIKGLRARPRLPFTGSTISPLWLLADRAQLALVLDPIDEIVAELDETGDAPLIGAWVIGRNPVPAGLRRVLAQAGIAPPASLPRPARFARRTSPRGQRRGTGRGTAAANRDKSGRAPRRPAPEQRS